MVKEMYPSFQILITRQFILYLPVSLMKKADAALTLLLTWKQGWSYLLADLMPQKCQGKNYHHRVKRVSMSVNYLKDIIHWLAFRNKLFSSFYSHGFAGSENGRFCQLP